MNHNDQEQSEKRHWLMRAKLRAPRQQVSLVARQHLTLLLDEALGQGLALIVAPAGFGKTTLLAQWRKEKMKKGLKIAWITLDEGDADAHQFIAYVIFALAEAGLDMGPLEMVAAQGITDSTPHVLLSSILERIAKQKISIILVLDDYHRLDCQDVNYLVDNMIAGCPRNFTLVINSRTKPQLNLAHYLAAGQAMEINANHLRFSRKETRAAVEENIDDTILEALFQRTEGWAVAIQLARLLVLGDRGAAADKIERFHGHSGHVATYLTNQVVEQLTPDVQDFLIKTAVLERFNAPLADALRQSSDSWNILKQLEPLHALLVPLEDASDWFRYHHLFAECLKDLLRRRYREIDINALHLAASLWLEKQGYISEAVRHARIAGDLKRCAELIGNAGGWELILFGGIGYLRNLLRNIPERELQNFPRMQVARAYLSIKDGEIKLARAYFDAADNNPLGHGRNSVSQPGFGRDLLNIRILLDTYEDNLASPGTRDQLAAVLEKISSDDGVTHGVIYCATVMHCLAIGAFDTAEKTCPNAMRSMRMANTLLGLNYVYLHAGLGAFYQAKFQLAEANFWEAQRMAEDNFGADSGLKSLANILLSALFYWRGGLADNQEKARFAAAFDYVEKYDGWLDIYATVMDVHSFRALNNHDRSNHDRLECRKVLQRCAAIASQRGIVRLGPLVDAHLLLSDDGETNSEERTRHVRALEINFPKGCWRRDSFNWRGYQVAAQALARFYETKNRPHAIALISDLIDCCQSIGARFHLIQALITRATLHDGAGNRQAGLKDLVAALEIAALEKILQPFLIYRSLTPLLRSAQKYARAKAVDSLTQSFIADCLTEMKRRNKSKNCDGENLFSPREREVLEELEQDLSNKEIARALDMTEHTVKFHLKNIFKKLNVDRRAQAIAEVQKYNIIR